MQYMPTPHAPHACLTDLPHTPAPHACLVLHTQEMQDFCVKTLTQHGDSAVQSRVAVMPLQYASLVLIHTWCAGTLQIGY